MLTVSCEHLVVEYTREELDIEGEEVIAHKFPCAQCDAAVLIWDHEVNYKDIT